DACRHGHYRSVRTRDRGDGVLLLSRGAHAYPTGCSRRCDGGAAHVERKRTALLRNPARAPRGRWQRMSFRGDRRRSSRPPGCRRRSASRRVGTRARNPDPRHDPATAMTTRVLIVDDHAPFRDAARAALAVVDDFQLVGEATSGEEAIALTES